MDIRLEKFVCTRQVQSESVDVLRYIYERKEIKKKLSTTYSFGETGCSTYPTRSKDLIE